jgi:hypothetical protein
MSTFTSSSAVAERNYGGLFRAPPAKQLTDIKHTDFGGVDFGDARRATHARRQRRRGYVLKTASPPVRMRKRAAFWAQAVIVEPDSEVTVTPADGVSPCSSAPVRLLAVVHYRDWYEVLLEARD